MSNLNPLKLSAASTEQQQLFASIEDAFGVVPNMFKTIGHSAAALESMWTSFGALGKGTLGGKLGEQIAVLVADINRCEYCLAAHTVLGQGAGASAEEMSEAQRGRASDARVQAALDFSKKLVLERGQVSAEDVREVKQAGFSDEAVAEILAHVALNIFTNYTNVAFAVEVDFPKIELTAS